MNNTYYVFSNNLFEQSKNGEIKARQAVAEAHLAEVYGNKNDVGMWHGFKTLSISRL